MAKQLNTAADTGSGSQPFVPDFASKERGSAYPHIPPTPPFVLVYSPTRWMVMDGRLVPSLSKLPLVDGVNAVGVAKNGGIRMAHLRARLEEEDRRPVPYEWAPDGVSYINSVETRYDGQMGTAYVTCFESVHAGDSTSYSDEPAYAAWLEGLVSSGKLDPCPPHRARKMLEQARTSLATAEAENAQKPSGTRALRIKALTEQVDALEAVAAERPKTPRVQTKAAKPSLEG